MEEALNEKMQAIEESYYQKGEKLIIDNSAKLDDFIEKFNALTHEFSVIKSKIDNEVSDKIEEGKSVIENIFDKAANNLNENYKNMEQESIERLNSYKKELVKIQDNMKQVDDRFTSRFLEHANQLDKRIESIDGEIRNFEKASNMFNRVDKLKESLEDNIKVLKDDIQTIKEERSEILKIEKKMLSIESIVATTHDKYRMIIDEKKKIESIELILEELRQISQNVDEKIDNIKMGKVMVENIDNKLDNINTKIKNLEEYYNNVIKKEDEVSKSVNLIDKLDRTSDNLNLKINNLEKQIEDLDFKKSTFEKSFKNFEKDANLITKSEKQVQDVIVKFKQMDSLIEDLEVRTDVINKHREWLVKAETQMVNLSSDTDKKIKLLQSLVTSGTEKTVKGKISNDQTKKDTVLKLKKQGWTLDEIAKTLNLSIGEVEFILDLEHSKMHKK